MPLLYGVKLRGECCIVVRLVLDRGHHAERSVKAPVVVPVDPGGGRVFDVSDGFERSGMEDVGAYAFGFI